MSARNLISVLIGMVGCSHSSSEGADGPPVIDARPDSGSSSRCMPQMTTDRAVYPEPALPSLPAAGGSFHDPTFGTTIVRATDAADCANCGTAYSYWPTFNVDTTRMQVAADAGAGLLLRFDPQTLAVTSHEPLFPMPPPGGATP